MYGQLVLPHTPIGFSLRWFDGFLAALAQKKSSSTLRFHTPHYIRLLYGFMDGVQEGDVTGEYYGPPKIPRLTFDAAAMSGDYNKPHVSGANPIAHGLHGVTELLEAFRRYHATHSIGLQPKGIDIQFRQKVPLDGNRLRHEILPFRVGDGPHIRTVATFSASDAVREEQKPAIIIKVLLEEGPFDRPFLGYNLYCAWLTSALLAQTWPDCIFYKLTAAFGEPLKEDSTKTTVREIDSYETTGKNGQKQKHLLVATDAGTFKGEADIILPAAD